ncbi:MAG: KH domain-containing protein [bacterium]
MENQDAKFLDFVIKALVDNPDKVKINRTVDEMGVLLTLDVDPADMGKVIGRMGNTAKAIRTLLRVVGMKNNSRVNLKINEPVGGIRSTSPSSDTTMSASKTVDEAMADLKL